MLRDPFFPHEEVGVAEVDQDGTFEGKGGGEDVPSEVASAEQQMGTEP